MLLSSRYTLCATAVAFTFLGCVEVASAWGVAGAGTRPCDAEVVPAYAQLQDIKSWLPLQRVRQSSSTPPSSPIIRHRVANHHVFPPVHLHPSTRAAIASILPEWTKGHLAPVAAWPDRVRMQLPWSGQLHYATPVDPEHPPESCAWDGTFKNDRNVINGRLHSLLFC